MRAFPERYGFVRFQRLGGYPDLLGFREDGKIIRIEVETRTSHFFQHGHDVHGSDLVIAFEDNEENFPLPVFIEDIEQVRLWIQNPQLKPSTTPDFSPLDEFGLKKRLQILRKDVEVLESITLWNERGVPGLAVPTNKSLDWG